MPGGSTTVSPSARQSSCMNTVSGPCGIGAPVKTRTAVPRSAGCAERVARRDAAGDLEPRFALRIEVVEEHRVAVDRGVVVRRHVARGDDVLGQDAAARRGQRRLSPASPP